MTEVPDVVALSPLTLMPADVPLPAASTWPLGVPRPVAEHWAALLRGQERERRGKRQSGA